MAVGVDTQWKHVSVYVCFYVMVSECEKGDT